MQRNAFCNFTISGLSLTDFGLKIPSPFVSLELSNSEITTMTSWTLTCTVGGDDSRKVNVAAFEALIYQASSYSISVGTSSGTPVSFMFGWVENGKVMEYLSYTGFYLQYSVTTNGMFMTYKLTGYAQLAFQTSVPVFVVPEVAGYIQPSALAESFLKSLKFDNYYDFDIDHNDVPVYIRHPQMTTNVFHYLRGEISNNDEYKDFKGCLTYAKSYNIMRDSAGMAFGCKCSTVLNNIPTENVAEYLVKSLTDDTPQCTSFSCWIEEPTATKRGVIHFKSNAGLNSIHVSDVLEYGTANTNILSISGSFNGIAYNMTDMGLQQVGFSLDASGNSISNAETVLNSFSNSLEEVYQTASIINDINAIASQFSGNFTVTVPGTVNKYTIAQPISLIVMSGNTLSPVSGTYNIKSVSHSITSKFETTLTLQRLQMGSANEVAVGQGILVNGSKNYMSNTYTTSNVITPYCIEFGTLYPTVEDLL